MAIQNDLFSSYKIDAIYLSSPFLYSNKYQGFIKVVFESQNKSISEYCLPKLEKFLREEKNLNSILSQMYTIGFLIITLVIGLEDIWYNLESQCQDI
tara:strand:+ start:265 stop:555 length:291 start_codon:yes stop_codon:yes gene_type:complete